MLKKSKPVFFLQFTIYNSNFWSFIIIGFYIAFNNHKEHNIRISQSSWQFHFI